MRAAVVCALVRDVSPETLRHYRVASQAAAHQSGRCAELWAAENRRRADRNRLDALADQDPEATR
ncbi:hypothetical protein AB0B15_38405 [Streptomyces sp. NPDC045456]|uniref:hypothetical protein n=1 Tax=Streptomyces sp. NPDC045456 TaxID=3155254 RepID=UPI00340AFDFA